MRSPYILSILVASASLVAAVPAADSTVYVDSSLRLIKTSELDPGTWVTEEEKIVEYVAKNINFIDITDITNATTLARLSTPPSKLVARAAAVTYPSTLTHQTEANTLIAQLTQTGPKSWLTTLTNYYNRYYRSTYGTQAGTWLASQLTTIAAANPAITVTTFTHSYSQPSIIVKIPGTSSNLIIVGAHYDSTGGSSTAKGPGADDNGSGVVTQMEALRVLANAKFAPKNTIELHFYSGEEGGLLGSADVFKSYSAAGKTVLAMVCQDMTGYSPSGKVSVYTDYSDSGLLSYVRKCVTAYTGLTYTTDSCGYGCSDHASAYSNGYPTTYVCDEPIDTSSPYIHSSQDTYATISFDAVLRHSKFTVGFLVEASYI
ncbi:peptidase family M28 [Pleomassaria siparia CBS 279.74]|uniref:Peptide hydrolase n=1 Tax=Pleomassaria siparia CBS 279.74 TaxID=1314801 RepID=A0A6G1KNQ8_9PLEO|nr:peptidase family M28 [Pleomassaria siparia CBS 279.74]